MSVPAMASHLTPNAAQGQLGIESQAGNGRTKREKQEWLIPVFSGPDSDRAIAKEGRKEGCRMP